MTPGAKLQRLERILRDLGPAAVAYSGGIDSTFLAVMAKRVLDGRYLAVTADSAIRSRAEVAAARATARKLGIKHQTIASGELKDRRFRANPPDRCFHCKALLWGELRRIARSHGLRAVVDGSTADDMGEFRPGRDASAKFGIRSPLAEAGLAKSEVRRLARRMGLPNWDAPSNPCLATRIPYGVAIKIQDLERIERSEAGLRGMGFSSLRVRHHGDLARIEIPARQFNRAWRAKDRIVGALRREGYRFVTLDLAGYQKGCYDNGKKDAERKNRPTA